MAFFLGALGVLAFAPFAFGQDSDKPKVAVFPLGGSSPQDLRDRIGFSIREKLDRDGTYDPLDGPAMLDMAEPAKDPLTFDTPSDAIIPLANGSGAVILVWGDVSASDGKDLLRLKTLNLKNMDAPPVEYHAAIAQPTDVRFVVEKFLSIFSGVKPFDHPNEQAVHHDRISDSLFASNPNLVINGDFSQEGHWDALYESEKYPVPLSDVAPDEDKVAIYHIPANNADPAQNVLAMNLSLHAAQNNGLAALSDAIPINPRVRYRIAFRYRSDGPSTHVFVKGYTSGKSLSGEPEDQEVYRLQVPPGPATQGQWQDVQADLNPQNPAYPVQRLRIDLYAYHDAGNIMFDDVELKAVGRETAPATQP